MACIAIPIPSIPTAGLGISVGVSIPTLTFDPTLCCKLQGVSLPGFALPLVIPIPLAAILILKEISRAARDFISSLPLDCPRQ